MQQTLLALLALLVASTTALNRQNAQVSDYRSMINQEMEILAGGIALHVMEMVGARAFDKRTTPVMIDLFGLPMSTSEFTPAFEFSKVESLDQMPALQPEQILAGEALPLDGVVGETHNCNFEQPYLTPLCNDVDDVATVTWQAVPFTFHDGHEVIMQVRIAVDYVEEGDPSLVTDIPTHHKRVIVEVRAPELTSGDSLPSASVHLERVFSYSPERALADHARIYPNAFDPFAPTSSE